MHCAVQVEQARQPPFHRRHLGQECVRENRKIIVDLVADLDARVAQHAGLPQDADFALELGVDLGLFRRWRRGALAPLQQSADLGFAVENGFAPHFGGMGGDHRHDQGVFSERRSPARR